MNEEKIKQEMREQIDKFIKLFTEHKRYDVPESMYPEIEEIVKKIIDLDLIYIDDDIKDKLKVNICSMDGTFSPDAQFSHIRQLDKEGNVEDTDMVIDVNMAHLAARLLYCSKEEIEDFCKKIIKNIFHEDRHLVQEVIIDKNISSKDTMMYTRDTIINSRRNNVYHLNYDSVGIETEARHRGETKFMEVMDDYNLASVRKTIEQAVLKKTGKYEVDGRTLYRDDMSVELIDYLICEEKQADLLKLYPPLLKEYNEDCTKKSMTELIYNLEKEKRDLLNQNVDNNKLVKDAQEMYFELIYQRLKEDNVNEIKELKENFSAEYINNLLDNMVVYFRQEKELKIEMLNVQYYALDNDYGKSLSIISDMLEMKKYYDEKEDTIENIRQTRINKVRCLTKVK